MTVLVSKRQITQAWNVTNYAVWKMLQSTNLQGYPVGVSRPRYRSDDVNKYIGISLTDDEIVDKLNAINDYHHKMKTIDDYK